MTAESLQKKITESCRFSVDGLHSHLGYYPTVEAAVDAVARFSNGAPVQFQFGGTDYGVVGACVCEGRVYLIADYFEIANCANNIVHSHSK